MAVTKTKYTTLDGEILSVDVDGSYFNLLPDPQGNVVAHISDTGTVTNPTTYWPYGEVRTGGTGILGFGGSWGYYTDSTMGIYIRARIFDLIRARWTTVDLNWPRASAFQLCDSAPVSESDPSGLFPQKKEGCEVWLCHAKRFLSHACLDVVGPLGGCSYSSYPDGVETCPGVHLDPENWDCELISNDCNYAGHICACVKESQKDNYLPWVCWGNARNKLCCGCHRLREPQRSVCESRNCAPAFQTCYPDTGGGLGSAGPGLPCK